MKIRMKGNSVRLRLSRSEVEEFGRSGEVHEEVRFGARPDDTLRYQIAKSPGEKVTASLAGGTITVSVPDRLAAIWVEGEQIGFSESQVVDEKSDLLIMVEKDFVCLTPRDDEETADNFPHPNTTC